MTFCMAYIAVMLVMHYGTAYFSPETVEKFDGNDNPPWILVILLWPFVGLVYVGVFIRKILSFINRVVMKAGKARKARKEQKKARVAVCSSRACDPSNHKDIHQIEAEQEVEEVLKAGRL